MVGAAALLVTLALASLASTSPAAAAALPPLASAAARDAATPSTEAGAHRALLDFAFAGSSAVDAVAGLGTPADDAVDDLVSALMDDISGSQNGASASPTITSTPTASPSTSAPPQTFAPTSTPTETHAPTPTFAPSASISATETGDVGSAVDGSSDGGPELEDNVLPAPSSKVPTKESVSVPAPTPTTAPSNEENVVAPATPTPTTTPTAPTATPTVVTATPTAAPAPVDQSMKNNSTPTAATDKSVPGIGQVHAPTYAGSLAKAVSGVGKNATEPSETPLPPPPPAKKATKKQPLQASGSAAAADDQSIESSNTSSGNMYHMGTSSILSIVGVIVGICAIVALFVVINRKNYGADSSDDELPVAYGYRIDGGSVVRLSPTFLHNGESSMVGSRVGATNDQERTSSSGESGEEKMPYFGSSFGFDNYLAQSHMMKSHVMMGSGGAGARDSALLAPDPKMSIFSSEASRASESWSSVMESEQDTMSRCTRDTSLSALTMPKQSDWDSSGRTTFGEAASDTSSNYRSTRTSSHMSFARDTMREDSSVSGLYSGNSSVNGGRSTSYSEFTRSTGAGSSIYSLSSP